MVCAVTICPYSQQNFKNIRFVIDVIKMMDLGLGFQADVRWLRLIFSNGFGGWNQSVYKSKHFPFRANNLHSNETWASRHQLQVNFDIDVWKASPISIHFMSPSVMMSSCAPVRKETSSLFKPRLVLAGQTQRLKSSHVDPHEGDMCWHRQLRRAVATRVWNWNRSKAPPLSPFTKYWSATFTGKESTRCFSSWVTSLSSFLVF